VVRKKGGEAPWEEMLGAEAQTRRRRARIKKKSLTAGKAIRRRGNGWTIYWGKKKVVSPRGGGKIFDIKGGDWVGRLGLWLGKRIFLLRRYSY